MRLALLGDMALFGRNCPHSNLRTREQLEELRRYLADFDMVVANLEAPICEDLSPHGAKSAHIRSGKGSAELLKWLGVTHVSLANNHTHDFGTEGVRQTIARLEHTGIKWFGLGDRVGIDVDCGNARLWLSGYCAYSSNPSPSGYPSDVALSVYDVETARADLKAARGRARLPILAIHSGLEHIPMPSAEDVAAARCLASIGDYIYYGHHPHVIQGIEVVRGSLLLYSLGNAIFDDVYTPKDPVKPLVAMSEENRSGLIIEITVEGDQLSDWTARRLWIANDGIKIFDDAVEYLAPINSHLADAETPAYRARRAAYWNRHVASRKRRRDWRFYVARLNFRSVLYLLKARQNARLQRLHVDAKLAGLVRE